MILAKAIKPARLREKAMLAALNVGLVKAGATVKKDFQGTTSTWTHKPKFEVVITRRPHGPELFVGTDDEIYRYVDLGTGIYGPNKAKYGAQGGYEIWAGFYTGKSDKKFLAFPSAFTPKTTPGSLKSGPGASGPVDTFRAMVVHPGIKPRRFSEIIAEKRTPWFKRQMEAAMRQAAKVSGNPI